MSSRRRFLWPDEIKQKAFGFFLMGKTAAYMFNDMRVSVRDDLTRSIVESWIGGWYRDYAKQPTPIFPGWHSSIEVTPEALRAWNYAWHESTKLGGSHLQPPYNILTMEPNPRSRREVPRTPQGERGVRSRSPPSNGLSRRDAEACEVLGLPTDNRPTHEEVKAQLRRLFLQFHPDKPGGTLSSEEKGAIFKAKYPSWAGAAKQLYPGTQFEFRTTRTVVSIGYVRETRRILGTRVAWRRWRRTSCTSCRTRASLRAGPYTRASRVAR